MLVEETNRIHCTACKGAGGSCAGCGQYDCFHGAKFWRTCSVCNGAGTILVEDASPEDRRVRRGQAVA